MLLKQWIKLVPGIERIYQCSILKTALLDFSGSLVVKILASTARRVGLISGRETKIPHAAWCSPLKRKEKNLLY